MIQESNTVEDTEARKLIADSEARLNATIERINEHYARDGRIVDNMLCDVWAALRELGWKPDEEPADEE